MSGIALVIAWILFPLRKLDALTTRPRCSSRAEPGERRSDVSYGRRSVSSRLSVSSCSSWVSVTEDVVWSLATGQQSTLDDFDGPDDDSLDKEGDSDEIAGQSKAPGTDDEPRGHLLGHSHEGAISSKASRFEGWGGEMVPLLLLGLPMTLLGAARTGQLLTDQAILGHLQPDESESGAENTALYLDAAALALLWINLTSNIVTRGVGGAINVLLARALGAGDKPHAAQIFLTGTCVYIIGGFFVAGLWLLSPPVLYFFAGDWQQPSVGLACRYTFLSIAWILPLHLTDALEQWNLAHEIVWPQMIVLSTGFFLNLGFNWVLVFGIDAGGGRVWDGLGFDGSPLGTTATRVYQLLLLLLLFRMRGGGKPSERACSRWCTRPLVRTPALEWRQSRQMQAALSGAPVLEFMQQAGGMLVKLILEEAQMQARRLHSLCTHPTASGSHKYAPWYPLPPCLPHGQFVAVLADQLGLLPSPPMPRCSTCSSGSSIRLLASLPLLAFGSAYTSEPETRTGRDAHSRFLSPSRALSPGRWRSCFGS